MLFEYPHPLFEVEDVTGGAATAAAITENITAEGDTGATKSGIADPIPDGTKPDAAWAEMRRKAQLADNLQKDIDSYKQKMEKLSKYVPERYNSLDEFLESMENGMTNETEEPPITPQIDEKTISSIVVKALENHPVIQKSKTYIEQQDKNAEDAFVVNNFKELQKKYPEIKDVKDVPTDVLEAFMKNEIDNKNYKRSLLSYYRDMKGDEIEERARKQGENQAKAQAMGTAHTSQVTGGSAGSEYESVIVPEEARLYFERTLKIKDPLKQKMYYKKFHRTE